MAQLRVVANKLNRRKSPVSDFANKTNIVEVVSNGFTFESVAQIENNLGIWHSDANGVWTWEKGVTDVKTLGDVEKQIQEINYTDFVANLNFDWVKTRGSNVTIGLIDTGIIANKDFYNNFKEEIISNSNNVLSHGNFIGGILSGKKNIIGIAKDGNLLSIKYKSDGDTLSIQLNNFIQALTDIASFNDSIILNISQGFNSQLLEDKFKEQKQQITTFIKQISSQENKLIFCAADDNSAINDILFPANMDECISIGCIDEFSTDLIINAKLNLLTPMVTFTSYDNSFNQIQNSGSSFSTALISSLAACCMSQKGGISKTTFLDELEQSSVNRSLFNYGSIKLFQYQLLQK